MAFDLDAPTVFRLGEPTLGATVLSLEYKGSEAWTATEPALAPPLPPTEFRYLLDRLTVLAHQVVDLEARLTRLERPPWWSRLHATLTRWWSRLSRRV